MLFSCREPTPQESKQKQVSPKLAVDTALQLPAKKNVSNWDANRTGKMDEGILSILQDRKHNYWMGTNTGVYRYDGTTLILFTTQDGLHQNQVNDIQEDTSGNIWFSTAGYGVNYFDGERIQTIKVKDNAHAGSSAGNNWKIEPGDLWFCAGGGAFCYISNSLQYFPFPASGKGIQSSTHAPYQTSAYSVYVILKDRRGHLWLGTQAKGVCRFDGKSFIWLTGEGLGGPAVLALFEDSKGNVWFGNNGKGLFCYDGKKLSNITEEKGLGNAEFIKSGKSGPGTLARVWALNEDYGGNLWIGTGDAGVWSYDGMNLVNYTHKNGLPDAPVETIYKNRNGELLFGTNGGGIYKLSGNYFTKFVIP